MKFLAQHLENNRYLINGNAINNNDEHLLTSYYIKHRAQEHLHVLLILISTITL